ncbi:hypothetical protein [Aliamphritea spongicola]|nr:hypothetical protein [Aliamphritea spongicola]
MDVHEVAIELNSESFDGWVRNLNPQIVMFDRFMMEEQFGWRVEQQCPQALRILDTEDLHSLRQVRHQRFKSWIRLKPWINSLMINTRCFWRCPSWISPSVK